MPIKFRLAFFLSFFSLLLVPLFFPSLHLFYFIPALVISIYRGSFLATLWKAFFCGLIFDSFSASTQMGITSLNYVLVLTLLYRQKRNFFEDSLSTLPLMTFSFSCLSTLLQTAFNLFFGTTFHLSFTWILTDLFTMPLLDALYGVLIFSLPFQLFKKFRKISPRREAKE